MKMNDFLVISVGGSIVVPDEIDTAFLHSFRSLLLREVKKGRRFVLIVGGGKTARRYQSAIHAFPNVTKQDEDELGIATIYSNAHLLHLVFKGYERSVIINPDLSSWKSGASSDFRSVKIAKKYKAKTLINLTNTDGVYERDPRKYKEAKRFDTLSWKSFRALLPKKWRPGLSLPFDPIAAREAERIGLEVFILNGKKIKEFEKAIAGKSFLGTTIKD